jgi:hypothetical protein
MSFGFAVGGSVVAAPGKGQKPEEQPPEPRPDELPPEITPKETPPEPEPGVPEPEQLPTELPPDMPPETPPFREVRGARAAWRNGRSSASVSPVSHSPTSHPQL